MTATTEDIRTFAAIAIKTRATPHSNPTAKKKSVVNTGGMTRIEVRERLNAQTADAWSLGRLTAVLEALVAKGAMGKSRDGSTYRVRSWERMQEAAR